MGTGSIVDLVTMIWIGRPRNPVRFTAVARGHFSAVLGRRWLSTSFLFGALRSLILQG